MPGFFLILGQGRGRRQAEGLLAPHLYVSCLSIACIPCSQQCTKESRMKKEHRIKCSRTNKYRYSETYQYANEYTRQPHGPPAIDALSSCVQPVWLQMFQVEHGLVASLHLLG